LKGNLVGWSSYSLETINSAKEQNRPIFIFIYSKNSKLSLKMEEEIFKSEDILDILNGYFISIKIDRYIRVDLFKYYKSVYKLINRKEANEPICIFATSTLEPFYAFGYIPKETRGNILGFRELLDTVLEKCKLERDTLVKNGKEILEFLHKKESRIEATKFDLDILDRTLKLHIENLFDKKYGGFGDEIKFLNSSVLSLMLCLDDEVKELAIFTLKKMAEGGVFNRDSKKFYKYGTKNWDYATSETLNYQNALLAKLYIRAYEITKDRFFKEMAIDILDNLKVEGTTSLNSMIVDSLIFGSKLDSRYLTKAISLLDSILESRYKNRELFHIDGIRGFLEDFAYFSLALLNSYRFSGNGDYLIFSQNILNLAVEKFYENGRWRFSNEIEVYEDIYDIDYPSSIGIILEVMESIMEFVEEDYSNIIFRTLQIDSYNIMRQPLSSPTTTKTLITYLKGEKRC
jgi:uncharacterized protein YyaL (SSP411 family)